MSRFQVRTFFTLITVLAVMAPAAVAAVGSPQPGEAYREFTAIMTSASQSWRVTDPNTPNANAQSELPNKTHVINIPSGQLNGAIRAEILFDYWGGHPGTIGQQFRFGSKPWISIPQLTTTPPPASGDNRPQCFMQQHNPVLPVPLSHLKTGNNVLARTSGNQTCYSFNWGQWGSYAATLRVYYNPSQVSNPTGSIISPDNGGTIGENPTIQVSASGGGGIARVDVLAKVDAYDWDGDGVYSDWGQAYHRAKTAGTLDVSHHVGTKTSGPWNFVFDTTLIPDQAPGSVQFLARILGNNGLWYVTPVRQNISLQRTGSVRLLKSNAIMSRFWTRANRRNLSSTITVPSSLNLNDLTSAKLLVRTWNGINGTDQGTESTKVNGWKIPGTYGENHHYSADVLTVQNIRVKNGTNTITFDSPSSHHGIEVLFPGPALLLRFGGAVGSFCGDGIVDAGEECDDGNNIDTDTCRNDCTEPSVGICGDGNVDAGEECDDGNNIDNDGCANDCTVPVVSSPLPALYAFEGSDSNVLDSSGNGNDGTLVGAVRSNAGKFGKALQFDGNSGHVNLGPLEVGGNQGTWAAFFKADDFGIADARILTKATSTANQDHYWMLSTFQQSAARRLRFRIKLNGNTLTLIGGSLTAGQWTHVAATYDGSTVRLYQDGAQVASAGGGGNITGNPGVEAWIGDHVGGGKSFDGLIDEVLIAGRAYSVGEIGDLLTSSVAGGSTCGDGNVTGGEECDDGNNTDGDGCQGNCMNPVCGDGIQDPGEQCDDGNNANADGCQGNCLDPACGDNIQDPGEQCDDGNNVNADGCQGNCMNPVCGDNIQDPGEQCDDGNNVNADGCQGNCMNPVCGDNIQDPGEQCDDGNNVNGDGCQGNCLDPACGDNNIQDPGEQCDDGNNVNADGCQGNCMNPVCGDNIQDPGEACDDGNNVNGDGCETACTASPGCGDGIVGAGEQCDDGNNVNGDGCQANCMDPFCGDGIRDPGEGCDDGNLTAGDGCDGACQSEAGGNLLFFFNGEGCSDPVCDGSNGYTLDPAVEFSAGDSTATFVSQAAVTTGASLYGTHGLDSPTPADRMKYEVLNGDIVDSDAGSVCTVYRRTSPAAAGHRLFIVQAPSSKSFMSLVYKTTVDLKVVYRDLNGTTRTIASEPWGGAAAAGTFLTQVSYDSAAADDSVRLIVNGVQRAAQGGSTRPLGAIDRLLIGNSTGNAGGHHFDQFLISGDPELDCWDLIAGSCSATASVRCLDDAGCPGAEICNGVVENYDQLGSPGTDNCPDDPAKTEPGVCGCGVPDDDTDGDGVEDCDDGCLDMDLDGYGAAGGAGNTCLGPDCNDGDAGINPGAAEITCDSRDNDCDAGTPDCPGTGTDPEILFFFNGEGCGDPVCDDSNGYTLDPVLEYSAGDMTAEFKFQGEVNTAAGLYGTHGFEAPVPRSHMKYAVADHDIVDRDAGSVCTIYRNGSPAAAGYRLFMIQAPSRKSYLSLVYDTADDLKFVYRDLGNKTTKISSGPWGGAATTNPLLVQVSYDSGAASDSLKLIVDGVERASLGSSVNPLGNIDRLMVGSPTSDAGSHDYDQFLVSSRPDLDCWDMIAGTCDASPQIRCIDPSDCPSSGTCSGVAEDYNELN